MTFKQFILSIYCHFKGHDEKRVTPAPLPAIEPNGLATYVFVSDQHNRICKRCGAKRMTRPRKAKVPPELALQGPL